MKFIKVTSSLCDNENYMINIYDINHVTETEHDSIITLKNESEFTVIESIDKIQELIKQSEFGYLSDFCNYLPKHKDNNQDAPFLGKPYCK